MHNAETTRNDTVTGNVTFLTVHAAAVRLGVTTRAIRARIKRGTLHAVKVNGARGPEWRVNLGTVAGDAVTGDAIPTTPPAWIAERAALLDQIAWLHQHVTDLTRILDAEREAQASLQARPLQSLPVVESKRRRRWFRLWG